MRVVPFPPGDPRLCAEGGKRNSSKVEERLSPFKSIFVDKRSHLFKFIFASLMLRDVQ